MRLCTCFQNEKPHISQLAYVVLNGQSLGKKDFTSLRCVNDINEAIRLFSCYGES